MTPEEIENVIKNRRTTKPTKMNGKKIPDEIIKNLLSMADWAPTHGHTEPWLFTVISGDNVIAFCHKHAEMYKAHTPAENFKEASYEKVYNNGNMASHMIAIAMRRGDKPNIPEIEEIEATACAVQNMWLTATAYGLAAYWGSGGMTYKPQMKEYFGLGENDKFLGFLFLGYSDEKLEGKRIKPAEQKFRWLDKV
jgi:nitroreductase